MEASIQLIIGSRVPEYLPGTDRIRGLKKNVQKAGVVPEICLVENILIKKALKKVFLTIWKETRSGW